MLVEVGWHETAAVVSGAAEGGLGEIVGTEGEEVADAGEFVGDEGGTWDFDHGAEGPWDGVVFELEVLVLEGDDDFLEVLEFLLGDDQWDHDFDDWVLLHGLLAVEGGLEDGADLHFADLWIHDAQSATTETDHWVLFVERVDLLVDAFNGNTGFSGDLGNQLWLTSWQEFM